MKRQLRLSIGDEMGDTGTESYIYICIYMKGTSQIKGTCMQPFW